VLILVANEIDVGIVRALARCMGADFEIKRIAL
jgi:hypothetical protein